MVVVLVELLVVFLIIKRVLKSVELVHFVVWAGGLFSRLWLFCSFICDWFEKLFPRNLAKLFFDFVHFEFLTNLLLLFFELSFFFLLLSPLFHRHGNLGEIYKENET